jgi:hypothetical protein
MAKVKKIVIFQYVSSSFVGLDAKFAGNRLEGNGVLGTRTAKKVFLGK